MLEDLRANAFRLSKWIAFATAGILSLASGTYVVAAALDTQQPSGSLLAWSIDLEPGGTEPLIVGETGVPLQFDGGNGTVFPIVVTLDDGTRKRNFTSSVTPRDGSSNLRLPPWFSGCQLAYFQTKGLPSLSAIISDGSTTVCPGAPRVGLFEAFGIPAGSVPTDSVRDLLNYLRTVSARADIDRLPADYRECLQQGNAEISQCLASLDTNSLAGQ